MKKYCTKCGHEFDAVGREVICPSCKAAAAEETKRAAVLKAKRASWTGESVPVRISGRASTVIRAYGKAHNLPFAAALDALLRTTDYFLTMDKAWVQVEPYKSRRRDKNTATSTTDPAQDVPQDAPQDKPQDAQDAQDVPHAAKASKTTSKTTSKTATSKSSSKSSKASKPSDSIKLTLADCI